MIIDINQLRPYPGNDEVNPACSAEADKLLRQSLAKEQRDPVHVMPPGNKAGLPDFTILDGHRRIAGLKANGATTVNVIIRSDLLAADLETVHEHYLSFNRDRRQLDPLALARNLREVYKNRRKLAGTLSRLLDTTKRNAYRYAHGAYTPHVIQNMHRRGQLRLEDLARVGMLSSAIQRKLAAEIAAMVNPDKQLIAQAVRRHLPKRTVTRHKLYTPIALRLIKNLKQNLTSLDGRFDKLYGPDLALHRDFLLEAKAAITAMIQASNRTGKHISDLLKEPYAPQAETR